MQINQIQITNHFRHGKYTFDLARYSTQDEKQKFIHEVSKHFKARYSQTYVLKDGLTFDKLYFIYEHVVKIDQAEWEIQKGKEYFQIYKFIPNILFSNTISIDLAYCGIANIQILAYLQAPNLKELDLDENHIMSIKPLAKNQTLRRMRHLSLYKNHITDFNFLQRSKFDNADYFYFDQTEEKERVACEDLRIFYKIFIKTIWPKKYGFERKNTSEIWLKGYLTAQT